MPGKAGNAAKACKAGTAYKHAEGNKRDIAMKKLKGLKKEEVSSR